MAMDCVDDNQIILGVEYVWYCAHWTCKDNYSRVIKIWDTVKIWHWSFNYYLISQ